MRVLKMDPIGGAGKFVEADETFVGGKARNRAYREPPPKEAVMALVERGGRVASFHVPNVTAATLKPIIAEALSTDSHFRTDESGIYWEIGEQFASHRRVVHSANEYVRGDAHTMNAKRSAWGMSREWRLRCEDRWKAIDVPGLIGRRRIMSASGNKIASLLRSALPTMAC
jgi:hypothetical protein